MKRIIAVIAASVVSMIGIVSTAESAQALPGSPKCMTFREWKLIKANDTMGRAKVKRITGIWGRVTDRTYYSDGTRSVDVDYRQCWRNGQPARGSWNTVWLSYDNYHYSWDYSQEYRHGLRVDYKGSWSTPF
jgi:hypothetical protein